MLGRIIIEGIGFNRKDKAAKWIMGTVGFAVLSAVVSAVMALLLKY
ncbi:MAG: hypothetical protein NC305_18355 [Lachnospiraceae bacterium]|nr:hypothetical protein [Acetatifactor muris]MCM1345349.1 hypothetical protein [Muribaculaceae bacterium]MCM1412484.1 hypothetical protein [Lachnospiraceae bacterium]